MEAQIEWQSCPNDSEQCPASVVLRLYSVKGSPEYRRGNSVIFCRLKSLPETLKSVLTIFAQFPKLDVAGSSPVSRSIFAIAAGGVSISWFRESVHRNDSSLRFMPFFSRSCAVRVKGVFSQ